MKRLLTFLFIGFAFAYLVSAQQTKVTGSVTSKSDGEKLAGASVSVKGTTNGTITDIDGKFSITTNKGDILSITSVGFLSEEITVGDQTEIDVQLTPDLKQLDEVVVTALGIQREKKALGYAVQEVQGDQLVEARDPNIVNSLSGKIAGLQVSRAGTGAMGSNRITIRGNSSLTGNNQPLIVIDGVPVNNYTGDANDRWGNRVLDYGSGLSDISADDIESVSVLKGPAAAALYGSRAGSGVIMITTKKGSSSGIGVTINSNTVWEQPVSYLDLQDTYGQGANGEFIVDGGGSWGPKMEGQSITDYTGLARPFSASENNLLKDFLQVGLSTTNSAEFTAGNEKTTLRAAITQMNSKGIIPNSELNKTNLIARTTSKIGSKLEVDVKANYIRTEGKNRPKIAQDPDNIFLNYLITPRSIHYSDLEDYETAEGLPYRWTNNGGMILNPYWTVNKNTNDDNQDRFIGMASVKYNVAKGLSVMVRQGLDFRTGETYNRLGTGVPYWYPSGDLILQKLYNSESTTEAIANYTGTVSSKVSYSVLVGASATDAISKTSTLATNGLLVKDFFSMSVGVSPSVTNYEAESKTHSVFGAAQLSYDNWVYLDLTAREDWSSTLNIDQLPYFYPSVGLGLIVTDMLSSFGTTLPEFISYAKVRGSFAKVGNGTSPYAIQLTYGIPQFGGGLSGATPPTILPNVNLKPENTISNEVGADIRFLQSRIGIDFTYFNNYTTNQIIRLDVPAATGYQQKLINAGKISNKGMEMVLNLTPIKTSQLSWDISFNFTKIKNMIDELDPNTKQQFLGQGQVSIVAEEGSYYGDIYGTSYLRDDAGNKIIDTTGLPLVNTELTKIGNFEPDWTGGISNSITYKGVNLSFLFDIKQGGDIYAGSIAAAAGSGTYAKTADYRDGGLLVDGVLENGSKNAKEVDAQTYWGRATSVNEEFIRNGSFVRLRELSIGYSLPSSMLKKTFVKSVKISLVGRNLLLLHSSMEGLDPESTYTTSNAQGLELGSSPSTRTYGFNINIGL